MRSGLVPWVRKHPVASERWMSQCQSVKKNTSKHQIETQSAHQMSDEQITMQLLFLSQNGRLLCHRLKSPFLEKRWIINKYRLSHNSNFLMHFLFLLIYYLITYLLLHHSHHSHLSSARFRTCPMIVVGQTKACQDDDKRSCDQQTQFHMVPLRLQSSQCRGEVEGFRYWTIWAPLVAQSQSFWKSANGQSQKWQI